jgi:hypothetical protein
MRFSVEFRRNRVIFGASHSTQILESFDLLLRPIDVRIP